MNKELWVKKTDVLELLSIFRLEPISKIMGYIDTLKTLEPDSHNKKLDRQYKGDGFNKEFGRYIIEKILANSRNLMCEHYGECMHFRNNEDVDYEKLTTLFVDIVQKALSAPDLEVLAEKLSEASKKKGY